MRILLAKGSKGSKVKELQIKLNKVLGLALVHDGDFGNATDKAVRQFQAQYGLKVDGIVGNYTWAAIDLESSKNGTSLMNFHKNRFVVFVDAGHGGINMDQIYTTAGKRAFHPDLDLHKNGHYYEGYENRIVAEMFIEKCTNAGIQTIRTYHPYEDTTLLDRSNLITSYLYRGYYGYLHSFHSNAISSTNSPEKLENTTGFSVYTTTDQNMSDRIAENHFIHMKNALPNWNYRTQKEDGDMDYESNFYILRNTDLEYFTNFGAILEEFGFHTSAKDCQFIVTHRDERTDAALATAIWTKMQMED
tara:strand:+ start:1782 stop:2693 length:912 start_codon:yes stop_codon:yes gene_type:complete